MAISAVEAQSNDTDRDAVAGVRAIMARSFASGGPAERVVASIRGVVKAYDPAAASIPDVGPVLAWKAKTGSELVVRHVA
jgi:hypothetical protein